MFLYGEQLKNEVSYILDRSEPSLFFINAYLTTSGSSTPLDVDINPIDTITIVQNFDSNYADIVMLQTRLLVKDVLYILDHYKDLHCSIQFKPDTSNALEDGLQEVNIEDYKVVINNADDIRKNINMNQFVNTNEEGDNGYTNKEQYYGQRIPITFELFSETLYDLRHITVATKLSNCTMEQAILYLANAYGIKSTVITPPDNTKVYRDIPIPPKVGGIEKSLTYLQKKFGIYSMGLEYYFYNDTLYVYPKYDYDRKSIESDTTVQFFVVPEGTYIGVESYHCYDDNLDLRVVLDGKTVSENPTEINVENIGNHFVAHRTSTVLDQSRTINRDGSSKLSDINLISLGMNTNTAFESATNTKFVASTNNAYELASMMSANSNTLVSTTWQKSFPYAIVPGTKCIYQYEDESGLKGLKGMVALVATEIIVEGRIRAKVMYSAKSVLTLRLDPNEIEI